MNIKETIITTFTIVLVLTFIIFIILYIWFSCTYFENRDILKETLTLTISCLGAFSTLGAAFIAASLFNGWIIQHNKTTLSNEALKIFISLEEYILEIETYSSSISNKGNFNRRFTEPYFTIFNKELILSDVLRDLKLLQNSYVVKVRMFLKLLPEYSGEDTTTLGLNDARKCFNEYFNYTQDNYIKKDGNIDHLLICKTQTLKTDISTKIEKIQKELRKYIIFNDNNK